MLAAGLTTNASEWESFRYDPTIRWTEEGGSVQPGQITAMKQIGDMMRNKSPLVYSALVAPVFAAGAFFGTPTPPCGTEDSTTEEPHLKLAKMILAQGPSIAKTPVINGMPSVAELMHARLMVNASEKTTRSSSAPVGKQNRKNNAKKASKLRKKNAGTEEQRTGGEAEKRAPIFNLLMGRWLVRTVPGPTCGPGTVRTG